MANVLSLDKIKQTINPTGSSLTNIEYDYNGEAVNADVYVRHIPVGEVFNNEALEAEQDVFNHLFETVYRNILNEDGTQLFESLDQVKSLTNKSLLLALGGAVSKVNNPKADKEGEEGKD